jgi:hypothetical protein
MRARTPFIVLICAAILASCSSTARTPGQEFRDWQLLTYEELNARAYNNAYQAVESLRSHWLRTRGPDSLANPTSVQVILNNIRLGDARSLEQISTRDIVFIRFYDAASASARWGRGLGSGVIHVSTERS